MAASYTCIKHAQSTHLDYGRGSFQSAEILLLKPVSTFNLTVNFSKLLSTDFHVIQQVKLLGGFFVSLKSQLSTKTGKLKYHADNANLNSNRSLEKGVRVVCSIIRQEFL